MAEKFRSEDTLLSIVIPFYNEENTICRTLDAVLNACTGTKKELLLVNDGSTDRSPELAENWIRLHADQISARLFHQPNGGKGAAVRTGITASTGQVLIIQDADCEYDPTNIRQCIEPILSGQAQVVYGSRELHPSKRAISGWKFYLGGLGISFFFNVLFGSHLSDEPTCYKTFDGDLIRSLQFDRNDFGWEPEITAKILRLGIEIAEVPIDYHPRKLHEGKKIRTKDGIIAIYTALLWRFRSIKKFYQAVKTVPSVKESVKDHYCFGKSVLILILLALLLRLGLALPTLLDNPENFLRPDSPEYLIWHPDFDFGRRGPLTVGFYALFAAFAQPELPAALAGILLSALTILPVACAGRLLSGNWKGGAIAGLFMVLNLTAIGNAPLLLSDTLFCLFAAFQGCFLLRMWKTKRLLDFGWGALFALLGAMTRGVNMPMCIALMIVALLYLNPWWKKLLGASTLLCGMVILLLPFMLLNFQKQAGFALEYSIPYGAVHNASAIIAHAENRSSAEVLDELLAKAAQGMENATIAQRNARKAAILKETIQQYPASFVVTHLPQVFLWIPDLPAVSENLNLTQSGGGTLAVIRKDGITAGIRYYFQDVRNCWMLALAPLALITLLGYFAGAVEFFYRLWKKEWMLCLLLAMLGGYYWAIPGPVIMPRYHLPSLVIVFALAGAALVRCLKRKNSVK